MAAILRTIPAILAALLLGAHFLRAQNLPLLMASLALVPLLSVPRRPVRLLCRIGLTAGIAEWGLTAWRIAQFRIVHGEPYLRMLVILISVAAFTAAAAWLLPQAPAARRTGGSVRTAPPGGESSSFSEPRTRTPKPEWS